MGSVLMCTVVVVVGKTACGLWLKTWLPDEEEVVARMMVVGRVRVVAVSVEVMAVNRGSVSADSVLMPWGCCVAVAAAWISWAFWDMSRVLPWALNMGVSDSEKKTERKWMNE